MQGGSDDRGADGDGLPIGEWELTACALRVRRDHGAGAAAFVATRIGALALAGDADGVRVWRAVAAIVDGLDRGVRH